jgi:hypothetical protein
MNKFLYLFVALIAIGFSSCSKDDQNLAQENNAPATLKLTIGGTGMNTRSLGTLPTGDGGDAASGEGTINRLTVGVFNGENVDVISEPTFSAGSTTGTLTASIAATAGNRTVIVVANAPAGHFKGITTRTGFLNATVDLKVTTPSDAGTSAQVSNDLPMVGYATTSGASPSITINLAASTTPTNAVVALTRLVSRISISSIKTAFDPAGQYNNAKFVITDVFLYNAATTSVWGDATNSSWVAGTTGGLSTGNPLTAGYLPYLHESITNTANTDITNPCYFYTFANGNSSPTKLIIKGKFDKDGDGTYETDPIYYPIVINKAQAGTYSSGTTLYAVDGTAETILPNKRYLLTATIKGIGTTDPTANINPANISLTVSVEKWANDITQNVDFN